MISVITANSWIEVGANIFRANSIQFNIVSKKLGCERMSFYLNEVAGDIRDMLMPGLLAQPEKAKL
jgi:carnitine O-acetyltransferase